MQVILGSVGGGPGRRDVSTDEPCGRVAGETTHVIIIEFPSTEAIRNVFKDPAYIELVPSRAEAFPVLDILISENFDPAALLQG